MGLIMSSMQKGVSMVSDKFYDEFVKEDIKDPAQFRAAILDIFNACNVAFPGTHFVVPSREEIKKFHEDWVKKEDTEKREMLKDFLTSKITTSKVDGIIMLTGLVTPPGAVLLKRAGEKLPQVDKIKYIPDVVFVPSATILALCSVKLLRWTTLKKP